MGGPRRELARLAIASLACLGLLSVAGGAAAAGPDPLVLVTADAPSRWVGTCASSACRSEIEIRADGRHALLRLWLGRTAEGVPVLGATAPLGLHLPDGIGLSLDGGKTVAAVLPLLDCSAGGCRAAAPASPALVQGLSASRTVTAMMRDARTRSRLGIAVPMAGFGDSLVPMALRR